MNINQHTPAESQEALIAARIRQARQEKGLSRPQLGDRTGIPYKTIEKFETGVSEPPVSRLRIIATETGVPLTWLLGIDDETAFETVNDDTPSEAAVRPFPASIKAGGSAPALASRDGTADKLPGILEMLEALDAMRLENFEGSRRKALAIVEDLAAAMKHLEPDELMELADRRGLFLGECPAESSIFDLFTNEPEKGQAFCGKVEERIVDTAVLGIDLFTIDRAALVRLAEALSDEYESVECPGYFSWGDHAEFVPVIRPVLRSKAVAGGGINFRDRKAFPGRT